MSASNSRDLASHIPSQHETNPDICAVDQIPFSLLSRLYIDLRNARAPTSTPNRRRPLSTRQQNESRHAILTRFWLQVCQKLSSPDDSVLSMRHVDRHIIPAHMLSPTDSFKLISLIVPQLDTTHAYLGMKETKLAESFIRALDLPPTAEDAQWLKHYKERVYRPRKWRQDPLIVDGNLASVLNAVLRDRCPSVSSLSVGIVWEVLGLLGQSNRVRNHRFVRPSYGQNQRQSGGANADSQQFQDAHKRSAAAVEDKKYLALTTLVRHGTAAEVADVAHIILKDLNMHLSQDNFLSWFHPSAKQHFTQIHDLHRLLADCHDPAFDIGDAAVQLGQYASVMLTMRPSRKNLPAICEKLRGGVIPERDGTNRASEDAVEADVRPYFIMEPKLDGERLQLHKWKPQAASTKPGKNCELRTFSRRGNDSSAMYSDALFDAIKQGVRAQDVILDGEIVIWDDLRATWLRFEDMREVTTAIARQSVPEGSSYTLKYMVFDVLYVDQGSSSKRSGGARRAGTMVMRLPLHKRRSLLAKLIRKTEIKYGAGITTVVEVVDMERGYEEQELTNTLQRYEALGYEGVIAKNPDMPYVLAERSLGIAIKLKPDYFDGGIQDLDVLILGAKYSTSSGHRVQRAGRLSSFLIGVRAGDMDGWQRIDRGMECEQAMKSCKWVVVGNVGTGYSDKDLAKLQDHFEIEWEDFDSKNLPDHFEKQDYSSTVFTGVAKWVQPWKSVVLTVRAFEVNRKFNLLRFPRVERINWEKPYYDVTTLSHLLDLDENKIPAFIKGDEADDDEVAERGLLKRKRKGGFDSDEEFALQLAKKEGHVIRGGRNARSVIASALGADVSGVERISEAFQGLTFHVIGTDTTIKEKTEVMIHKLGGLFVQNVSNEMDFVICASSHTGKVKRLKERATGKSGGAAGHYSIITASWVDDCYEKRTKTLPTKTQIVYANRDLEADLYKDCDRFGDSWTGNADMKSFQASIDQVGEQTQRQETKQQAPGQRQLVTEVDNAVNKCFVKAGGVFRDVIAFVPPLGQVKLHGSLGLLKAFGGRVADRMSDDVTHVIVHSSVTDSTAWNCWLRVHSRFRIESAQNARIISEDWILKNC